MNGHHASYLTFFHTNDLGFLTCTMYFSYTRNQGLSLPTLQSHVVEFYMS